MSGSGDGEESGGGGSGGGGPGRREVAYRLFAAEYDDADLSYSESDEERAPNYVVTPSGARVNRLFVVGVLTEVESVSEDYLRARVVDPTGPFVVYAGQYQPEAMRFLESAEPPTFVAVTGKARTFQPDDSDRVYTSVRPESINEVDAGTRDRWVIQAAEGTLERVARVAEAKASGLAGEDLRASLAAHGVDEGLASGVPAALDHYGTSGAYLEALRDVALDALRVIAGEQDEVDAELPEPDQGGDEVVESLVEEAIEPVEAVDGTADAGTPEPEEAPTPSESGTEPVAESESSEPDETDASEPVDETDAREPVDEADDDEPAEPPVATAEGGTEAEADASAESESGASASGIGDFDGEFDLDDDEREEIEAEYGTEFKSGSEVGEPGEAGIETPVPEDASESAGEADVSPEDEAAEPETAEPEAAAEAEDTEPADVEDDEPVGDDDELEAVDEEPGDEEGDEELDSTAAEIALDDAVMDAMVDLDDGDGADRSDVVAEVVDATGADPGDVEDAIQDALMDGLCYEPEDGRLKPI